MSKFSDFLIFCSGANRHYLDQCPNERHKFYPIGLSILVTTCLAIISMYYAANMIFGKSEQGSINQGFIIIFSLFWGLSIFSIDWGLVKTMRKPPLGERSFWRSFLPVVFRLLVAVLISISISRPLEVAIYEKRLKAQIEMDRQEFIRRETNLRAKENEIRMVKPMNSLIKKNSVLTKDIAKGPTTRAYNESIESLEVCEAQLNLLSKSNNAKIAAIKAKIQNINRDPKYRDAINDELTRDALNLRSNYYQEITRLENAIRTKASECNSISDTIKKMELVYSNLLGKEQASNLKFIDLYSQELSVKKKEDSIVKKQIEDQAKISFDPENPGLITSLESLANFEKTPEGKKVWIVRIILLLIFICIDTAPIVVKLLTKRGPYEEIQEAEEEKMRYLATAEKSANMLLISNITAAQNRILRQAVSRYEREELEKLRLTRDRFRAFIQTDPENPDNSTNSSNSPEE